MVTIMEKRKISDGYHTFDDLYNHRHHLFIALMVSNPSISWRSLYHEDGTMFSPDWFIAGINLPTGTISYHLPMSLWAMLNNQPIETRRTAPKWDGHAFDDIFGRLREWVEFKSAEFLLRSDNHRSHSN